MANDRSAWRSSTGGVRATLTCDHRVAPGECGLHRGRRCGDDRPVPSRQPDKRSRGRSAAPARLHARRSNAHLRTRLHALEINLNGRLHGCPRQASVRHQATHRTGCEQFPRHTSEHPLAEATVSVGAGDQKVSPLSLSDVDQLGGTGTFLRDHDPKSALDTVLGQIVSHVIEMTQGRLLFVRPTGLYNGNMTLAACCKNGSASRTARRASRVSFQPITTCSACSAPTASGTTSAGRPRFRIAPPGSSAL